MKDRLVHLRDKCKHLFVEYRSGRRVCKNCGKALDDDEPLIRLEDRPF